MWTGPGLFKILDIPKYIPDIHMFTKSRVLECSLLHYL